MAQFASIFGLAFVPGLYILFKVPGRGCLLLTLSVKAVLAEGPSSDTSQHLQVWGSLPSGALQCSSCYTQLWVLGGGGGFRDAVYLQTFLFVWKC